MSVILKTNNLIKYYDEKKALDGISIEFEIGKIYGFLGPNGSGKTTFLRACAALIKKHEGEVLIDGLKPGEKTKAIVAYLPDYNYFFDWMKVKDALSFFDDFFEDFDREKSEKLLADMELEHEEKISKLSKGMLARMKLAIILGRKAKLYLLDEPFDGIDGVTREKIIKTMISTFSKESTIIVATHHITYVEKLLDSVKFLYKGKIIDEFDAEDIRRDKGMTINEYYLEEFRDAETD